MQFMSRNPSSASALNILNAVKLEKPTVCINAQILTALIESQKSALIKSAYLKASFFL